ncbi:maleylacetoacetate isomerase [Massilia sp. DWR3-1-1]|uniref:maleylacetoacetate isomerase n=1 Tax=Massilia sp. DWR3-1-1 TaxID=2804559 RepID=UPI003CF697DE
MKLYTYFRSSAAYRVRIALNLKGLSYEAVPVHLLRDGGVQRSAAYRAVNPSALLPSLEIDDGSGAGTATITQSLAIIEYLDETHPGVPLLPQGALARARTRELALLVACDIHPLCNLRVLQHLAATFQVDESARNDWYRHWVREGLDAFERHLAHPGHADVAPGQFCVGDAPSMADCCLVPQVFNARRFALDVAAWPLIEAIDARCAQLPAFQAAQPGAQPDAE